MTVGVLAAIAMSVPTPPALQLHAGSKHQVVFDWSKSACNPGMIPDAPVRAIRTSAEVSLYLPHQQNFRLTGPSLDALAVDCEAVLLPPNDPDPDHFRARIWLQSLFVSGTVVHAIGSSDYHGTWFDRCDGSNPENSKCWTNALVQAVSEDGGASFTLPSDNIIARPAEAFDTRSGPPSGFFSASNMIEHDGYVYAMIFASAHGNQKRGVCLIRSSKLSDPASWRAWDGDGYDQALPRRTDHRRACAVIPGLGQPIRSVVLHRKSRKFIALYSTSRRTKGQVTTTFDYRTSSDLVSWSSSATVASFTTDPECPKSLRPAEYPALIDPYSPDPNFIEVGDSAFLYYTRSNAAVACRRDMDRDLVRVPVTVGVRNGER